ncbi:hypothetical protein [Porphyromonas cangingivalis]|uniref:hypothetical protein n=1 Tax=Porphyromonas cangingivalis TaxID=36874 RepID=UPI000AEA0587|nr:hypothetical protein [Porphyromonas cangingivalis]
MLRQKTVRFALSEKKTAQYKGFEHIGKIRPGDLFLLVGGTDRLIGIDEIKEPQETYTISRMSAGDHFIANGLLVGVESLRD